ncbi:laminin subunit alpha-4-like [Hetaerina americana]|uniref:laminin subunit alpha-4-like n=1 Tax=Hetaerina americana TaxID=62018 RepID=UPI003A7F1F03
MVDGSFQLNFRFKSNQESALLFYATDPSQMNSISLSLVNGVLVLSGPQGKIQVSSSSKASLDPIKYNDDTWHTVTATYASNLLSMEIDDFRSSKRGPSRIFGHGDQILSVYFGGVPDGFNIKGSHVNSNIPFIGCMGDATFGSDVINFANASKSYNIILGKCVTNGSIFVKQPVVKLDARSSIDEGCSFPMSSIPDQELVSVNGYRFGTRPHSHLVFLKPPNVLSNKYKFEVEFNTIEEEGIIFYLASNDHKTFLALYLHHGKLYYKFGCEDGTKKFTKISTKMNDGTWHNVAILRHTNKARITVDQKNKTVNSQCPIAWMKIVSSYFVGGIPQSMKVNVMENLGLNKSFSGCLRNPKDSPLGVLQPDVAHSVIPCSEQVEKGVFFSADGGHVIIDDNFAVGTQIIIGMEIKPRSLSGVLMSVHGKKDYLVLQMYKGAVLFNVENGKGNIFTEYRPTNQSFLCNGEWHKIIAIKNKNMISLSVDSSEMTVVNGPVDARSTDTHDPLYVGGHAIMHVRKIGLKPRRQFVGCIRNISINSKSINMADTKPVGNVMMGVCPTI